MYALGVVEVQKVYPGAKPGERNQRLESYGSKECQWKGPSGDLVLALQESIDGGGTAKADARGMATGFADPTKPQALSNVRIETFPSIRVDPAAFVEKADPARGILNDAAMLELRNGPRSLSILTPDLPQRDRTSALKALEALGRAAAARLLSTN